MLLIARRATTISLQQRALCASTSAAKASLIRSFLVNKSGLFKKLDTDGSGSVDAAELQAALKEAGAATITLEEAASIIREADKDGNGTVEINELAGVLTKGTLFDGVIKR